MKSFPIVAAFVFLISCDSLKHGEALGWHTIAIGDYLVDCPADFELIKKKETNPYVGKLKGDSLTLYFDLSHSINNFTSTAEQYLESKIWVMDASYQFLEGGKIYTSGDIAKMGVLSMRVATAEDRLRWKGCGYVARCRHEESEFDYPINLPQDIQKHNVAIDTIDSYYRKRVTANDPKDGITGIFIRDLNGFNESINGHLALSIKTGNITKSQQKLVVKILATVRPKSGR